MKRLLTLISVLAISLMSNCIISAQSENNVQTKEGRIIQIRDPIDKNDVATKNYVDNKIEGIQSLPAVLQTEGNLKLQL